MKQYDMQTMPLTGRHIWIVFVASLGQFIGTGVATLAGVIIPMINILHHPELSSAMQGLVGAIDLIGIAVGSVVFGRLTDRYGYIFFFRFCPALVLVASLAAIFFPGVWSLTICLFFIGLGIGGEYSLDSDYISELMPVKWRSTMIGIAKAGSAFGNILVALICFLLVSGWRNPAEWPNLMWIVTATAALMLLTRIRFYQSPKWLEEKGRMKEAATAVRKFLGPDVTMGTESDAVSADRNLHPVAEKGSFLRRNLNKVILSGIPWACEGLGVYGIGVFLPILVMALGIEHIPPHQMPMAHIASSVWITFLISCIILPGFLIGLLLLNRKMSICNMQTWGFALCALAMTLLLLAFHFHWAKWISIAAFMTFELFLNLGPHLVTYVLPPRIYPVADRGLGTGIAASLGKTGAVIAVFTIPILLKAGGPVLVLLVSAAVMAAGAVVTAIWKKKVFK